MSERATLAPGTYWIKRPGSDWVAAKCGRIESGRVIDGIPTTDEILEIWTLPGEPWSITNTEGWEIGPRILPPDAPDGGELAEARLRAVSASWRERATYLRTAVANMGGKAHRCEERADTLEECAATLDIETATRAAVERRADFGPLARALKKLIPDIGDQIQRALDRLELHQVEALREFEDFLRRQ